jgi:hypothetical protein
VYKYLYEEKRRESLPGLKRGTGAQQGREETKTAKAVSDASKRMRAKRINVRAGDHIVKRQVPARARALSDPCLTLVDPFWRCRRFLGRMWE